MDWRDRRWGKPLPQDYASRLARADDTVDILAGKLERAKTDRITMIANEARIQRFRNKTAALNFACKVEEEREKIRQTHCCCCKAGY